MPSAQHCGAAKSKGPTRPRWELADIIRLHGDDFRRSRPLPQAHLKILRDIERCRTPALGGHLERCDHCGFERPAYNSCRNRHCPKCRTLQKAKWVDDRIADLLPVGYFHEVFTLPHELNPITLRNKEVLIGMLFDAVAQTIHEFARDPKSLGGKIGFIAVLHTWDQKLMDHFHLHCVIPGGALSMCGDRWISASPNFLFPVKALSVVFRRNYLERLKSAFAQGRLVFPGSTAALQSPEAFQRLIDVLFAVDWVVYSKAPFGGPEKVLDYLGRDTHRVAISNNRILNVENGFVTFSYRDRQDDGKPKALRLPADEFLRRFLLHSLPSGFVRIRHFGFLAGRCKNVDLAQIRKLLGVHAVRDPKTEKTPEELFRELTGQDMTLCPKCKIGKMRIIAEIPRMLPLDLARLIPFDSS